jgi:hypothetical protein
MAAKTLGFTGTGSKLTHEYVALSNGAVMGRNYRKSGIFTDSIRGRFG